MPCRLTSEHFGPFRRKLPEESPLKPADRALRRCLGPRFSLYLGRRSRHSGIMHVLEGRDVLGRDAFKY